MTVPPTPSFQLTKPLAGRARARTELQDGASSGLERDPVGPLGTPTRDVRKAEERMAVPKEKTIVPRTRCL